MTRTNIQGDIIGAISAIGTAAHQATQIEKLGQVAGETKLTRQQGAVMLKALQPDLTPEERSDLKKQIALWNDPQWTAEQEAAQEAWENENRVRKYLNIQTANTIHTKQAVEARKASFINPITDLSE